MRLDHALHELEVLVAPQMRAKRLTVTYAPVDASVVVRAFYGNHPAFPVPMEYGFALHLAAEGRHVTGMTACAALLGCPLPVACSPSAARAPTTPKPVARRRARSVLAFGCARGSLSAD